MSAAAPAVPKDRPKTWPKRLVRKVSVLPIACISVVIGAFLAFIAAILANPSSATKPPAITHANVSVHGKDPFVVVDELQVYLPNDTRMVLPHAQSEKPDVTAILLNWKRSQNLPVLVAHLCQHVFIEEIIVWNNNPEPLDIDFFAKAQCSKVQINNSPTNDLFIARHRVCASAGTPHCLHLDDEYVFKDVESLYSVYKADPERLVAFAEPDYYALSTYEWCFHSAQGFL